MNDQKTEKNLFILKLVNMIANSDKKLHHTFFKLTFAITCKS